MNVKRLVTPLAMLLLTVWMGGSLQAESGETAEVNVKAIEAAPATVSLRGANSRQQLIVTATGAEDQLFDATHEGARYTTANPQVATISSSGVVSPVGSGTTDVVIAYAGQETRVPVTVEQGEEELPVDFTNGIVPIFTKLGCNGGGCHGKSTGKGGFKLSLFGFEPEVDYTDVVHGGRGRRLFPGVPDRSLLLLKPTLKLAHGGGLRLRESDPEYKTLRRWIATGSQWGELEAPRVKSLELEPQRRQMRPGQRQQFIATAFYEDGAKEDVTRLVKFESTATSIAAIDEGGLLTTQELNGQTAVIANLQGVVAVSTVLVPQRETIDAWPQFPVKNFIDELALAKFRELNIPPSEVTNDSRFLRRAMLQITGQIPTPEEVREFLADADPQKRDKLVGRLTASGEYADLFAQKWSAILRNKRRGEKDRMTGTIGFHRWIRNAIAHNTPYDQFVREVVTASGDPATYPPAQWYHEVRYLHACVDDTAQAFLGVRIGCARCHHHPFESFSQADYYGLASFFARVDRKGGSGVAERASGETIFSKPMGLAKHEGTGEEMLPRGLGGEPVQVAPYEDPRPHLVDWMTDQDNPYFARAFVNRMWAHFFGRGLVDEPDDLRVTNPATNEELLDALAQEFIRSKFDMRHVVQLICSSTTYQLSSDPNDYNRDELQNHSRFYPRFLPAEVLADAIDRATGVPTRYSGLPAGTRAVQLPDEGYSDKFLKLFGRPPRESACECERTADPNLAQSLYLMNDNSLLAKITSGSSIANQLAADQDRSVEEKVDALFLQVLSRPPTDEEIERVHAYFAEEENVKEAWQNLLWALLNTKEFLYVL